MSDFPLHADLVATPPVSATGINELAGRLNALKRGRDLEAAERAAKDFESVLLYKLMEEMKRTVPESDLFSTGASRQVEGIFWYYLAQEVAKQGGLGVWREIYKDMMGTAAGANSATTPSVELYR